MSGKKEANMAALLGKAALHPAGAGAAVGGLGTAGHQALTGEFDSKRILRNAAIGAGVGAGAGLGAAGAMLAVPRTRAMTKQLLKAKTPQQTQQAQKLMPENVTAGEALAGPAAGIFGAAVGGKGMADLADWRLGQGQGEAASEGIMKKASFQEGFSKGVEKVAENLAAELNISKEDALAELNDKIAFMGGAFNAAKAFGGNLMGGLKTMGGALQRGAQGAMKNMGANASRNGVAGVGKTLQGGAQAAQKGFQRGMSGINPAHHRALKNTALAGGGATVGFEAGRM